MLDRVSHQVRRLSLRGRLAAGASLIALVTLFGGFAWSTPSHAASSASGGGCGQPTPMYGMMVAACINVSNGVTVNSDGYATGRPTVSDCHFSISLVDTSNPNFSPSRSQQCGSGHLIGPSQVKFSGTYYTEICASRPPPGIYPCVKSPLQRV